MKSVLRRFKSMVRRAMHYVDGQLIRAGAKNRRMAVFYYILRGRFSREQQSVLAGKLAYKQSLHDPSIHFSLLRRNVHRLEKGMLMRPRRVPFGLNYIAETVDAYAKAVRAGIERNELAWAHDVLSEYMNITPEHPAIEPLREVVRHCSDATHASPLSTDMESARIPYRRLDSDAPNIAYEEFLRLTRYRRSVRWYLQQKVPRELIDNAIEAAAYSPTACNRLPYEFRIFDDPALVERAIRLPMGTSGFSHQVPAVAVVVGKQRYYFNERDRHLIYIDGSLAIMSFVYALEVQGLASCCINWPDVEDLEQKMASFLGLADDERPIMLVAFGYPDPSGMVANSTKKPLSSLRTYNFE